MAGWLEFTQDWDYRWPSLAVTAFKEGMKVYVKSDVEKAALEAKVAKKTKRPEPGDPAHQPTKSAFESRVERLMGNSVAQGSAKEEAEEPALPPAPDTGGTATGDALSAASGGEAPDQAAEAENGVEVGR